MQSFKPELLFTEHAKKKEIWDMTLLRERPSKLIRKNWISLEKSKFRKEQMSHVSVGTTEIVSWVQSFLKNIEKKQKQNPRVVSWKSWSIGHPYKAEESNTTSRLNKKMRQNSSVDSL